MLNLLKDIFPFTLLMFIVISMVFLILLPFIAAWKLFKKVGIPGWKSLIPVYNEYLIFKISGMSGLCIVPLYASVILDAYYTVTEAYMPDYMRILIWTISVILLIINIIKAYKLPKAFGRGIIYMIGMFFFREIFEIILGMDKSKYVGPYEVE